MDEKLELYHHGVKGMKWGVRKEREKVPSNRKVKKQRKKMLKNRRRLSDEELDKAIVRLEKERRFRELSKDDIAVGRKKVASMLDTAGSMTAKTLVSGAMLYAVKYAVTKNFDPVDFAKYITPVPKRK